MPKKRVFPRGYTLIEILIGLTVISLLFSLGFVSFRDFSRRQALFGVGRSLKGDLRLAQEQALSGGKPSGVSCNPPNLLNGYNFRVTSTTNYTIEANCSGGAGIVTKSVDLPSDITISNPSPNPVIFKVLGQGTNLTGVGTTVTLTQAGTGNTYVVTITPGGEIR